MILPSYHFIGLAGRDTLAGFEFFYASFDADDELGVGHNVQGFQPAVVFLGGHDNGFSFAT